MPGLPPSVAPLPLPLTAHRHHQAGAAGAPRRRRSPTPQDTQGPARPEHGEKGGYSATQSPRPTGGGGARPVQPQHRPARHSGATESPLHSRHGAPEAAGPSCLSRPGETPGNGFTPSGRARLPRDQTSGRGPTHRPQRRSRRCVSQAPALTSAFTRSASGPDHPFRLALTAHRQTQLSITCPRPTRAAPLGEPRPSELSVTSCHPAESAGSCGPGASRRDRPREGLGGGARTGRGGRGQRLSGAGAGKIEPLFLSVAGSVGEAGRNNTNSSRGGAAPAAAPGQTRDPPGDPGGSSPGPSSRQISATRRSQPRGSLRAAPSHPTAPGSRGTPGGAAGPGRAVGKAPWAKSIKPYQNPCECSECGAPGRVPGSGVHGEGPPVPAGSVRAGGAGPRLRAGAGPRPGRAAGEGTGGARRQRGRLRVRAPAGVGAGGVSPRRARPLGAHPGVQGGGVG